MITDRFSKYVQLNNGKSLLILLWKLTVKYLSELICIIYILSSNLICNRTFNKTVQRVLLDGVYNIIQKKRSLWLRIESFRNLSISVIVAKSK